MHMSNEISDCFTCTIGLKKGCPISTIIFGTCIDELEQMVAKVVNKKSIEEVGIGIVVIMLLLWGDGVVSSANIN